MLSKFAYLFILYSGLSFAGQLHVVDVLGSSAKGQFVALEEYGYRQEKHSYFVTVKILNMWKEEYVGQPLVIEVPAHRPAELEKARARARHLAQETLQKYNIISG